MPCSFQCFEILGRALDILEAWHELVLIRVSRASAGGASGQLLAAATRLLGFRSSCAMMTQVLRPSVLGSRLCKKEHL